MTQPIKPLWYRRDGTPIWPIMGGDGTDGDPGAPGDGEPTGEPTLALPADVVRNTPEYRALQAEVRKLARQKGQADQVAAAARAEAEAARQAAEASQQAELERQLVSVLGDDGVAAWAEIAELSATDQVAAARRFAELMGGRAQSAPPATPPAAPAPTTPPEGEGQVTVPAATTPPPPPGRGVEGAAPLGQPSAGEDVAQVIAGLQARYQAVVERNQDAVQRNRVTMRDRSEAFISYLGAAYLKATGRNGRG